MRHHLRAVPALAAALLAVPLLLATPARAEADLHVSLNLGLPVAPPLVAIRPGVMVVEDFDDEVFVVSGVYWARRGDRWYRAPGPRAGFVFVERQRVPSMLVKLPPGQYKKWKKKHDHDGGRDRDHDQGKRKGKGHDKH
jgi:hypothetical protein